MCGKYVHRSLASRRWRRAEHAVTRRAASRALIAFLLAARGDGERAARYRQATSAWTDAFFLGSAMRTTDTRPGPGR
jgi:hypothetical protein